MGLDEILNAAGDRLTGGLAVPYSSEERRVRLEGVPPYPCADGWFWISASRNILEPLTDEERRYWESHELTRNWRDFPEV